MQKRNLQALLIALALLVPSLAHALPRYSAIYVFGDSLSDRGNLAEAVEKAFADPPSFHNSFTNGPVAVSVLASRLGLTADASLWVTGFADKFGIFGPDYVPGTNYAVGGATAQETTPNGPGGINLPDQIDAYLNHVGNTADPNALYTIFIGGNDVRGATLPGGGGATAIANAVTTEMQELQALLTAGARDFLVVNVSDVGAIPQFALENPSLAPTATAYTKQYNAGLAAALDRLAPPPGTDIVQFDLFNYDRILLANASRFGLTNIKDPCYDIPVLPFSGTPTAACGPNAANIDQFAFWNDVHPTRQVHALIAEGFAQALDGNPSPSPIPEPTSLSILMAGLLAALGLQRARSVTRAGSVPKCGVPDSVGSV
jgi:outer membrane lipase/esterase